jgi:hypothetical protein
MKNTTKISMGILFITLMVMSFASTASAAILFQDDTFDEVQSDAIMIGSNDAGAVNTAIQFGADVTASENGNITWNIGTNSFSVDHTVDVTGGLSATGDVNFSGATQTRLREASDPNTNAACQVLGEVIIDTNLNPHVLKICTTVGLVGAAVWTAMPAGDASTLSGLTASQFLRSDAGSSLSGLGTTLTTNAGTTVDVNGALDASGGTIIIPTGAGFPASCTLGDIYYDQTSATLNICSTTGTPGTWTVAGPQDFESIYTKDTDKTLTTGNGSFAVATGTGTFGVTSTNTTANAINLTASTTTGGITANAGTGGLNFNSTGLFNIQGAADSNITTTGVSDITLTAGDDLYFDDAQLLSAVQLTDTATAIAATYGTNGIIDALNSLTSTSAGAGASNVGIPAASLTNVTPATNDVQAALVALDAKVGAGSPNVENLTFYPEYPDAVIYPDGSANNGTLTSNYDSANKQHYYQWTTNNPALQDMDVRFRFPLPADFATVGSFTGGFRTGSANAAQNKIDYSVADSTTGFTCGSSTANVNTVWTDTTIVAGTLNTGCATLTAGDIMEITAKLYDINGAGSWAQAGRVILGYSN